MSAATVPPFNKSESTPQSIQRLLDENAQLIKALVENMSTKGKSMECIQYQQTLHRNLVFLAGLADPNLNIQAVLPSPSSNPPRSNTTTQLPPPATTTPAPFSTSSGSSPGSAPLGAVSNSSGTGIQQHQVPPRQPQATMTSTSSESQWSANTQTARATPPSTISAGQQYPSSGNMRNFEGAMWSNQGQQQGMYGMQRGSGYGSMMGMSPEDRQRQQMLRMRQEQLIQAQQMRRMQMQQQQQGGPGSIPAGGGMYPGMGPTSGMMPPGGMPPGYPQTSMMQMSMPPGPMNLQ